MIETKRLILRELNPTDASDFYKLNLNQNVIKYTGDSSFKNIDEARDFLQNYSDYKKNGYGRWAVVTKENQQFIGWCGLKLTNNETDIGFRFFEEEWNKGYATESAKACLDYGFQTLKIKTIIGRAMKDNVASIKVLEKIGLVYLKDFDFDKENLGVIYKIDNPYKLDY